MVSLEQVERQLSAEENEVNLERAGKRNGQLLDVRVDGSYGLLRVNTGSDKYTFVGNPDEAVQSYVEDQLEGTKVEKTVSVAPDGGTTATGPNEYSLD